MLPIRDTIRSRTRPVVTVALIAANVLAFVYELSLGGVKSHGVKVPWRRDLSMKRRRV